MTAIETISIIACALVGFVLAARSIPANTRWPWSTPTVDGLQLDDPEPDLAEITGDNDGYIWS